MDFTNQINIFFGAFAFVSALFVWIYRKNFPLHSGIVVLLFSMAITSAGFGLFYHYHISSFQKLIFLGKALTPVFLLVFSEYILKLNFNTAIKSTALFLTVSLGMFSFFQWTYSHNVYFIISNLYYYFSIAFVIIKLFMERIQNNDRLLKRYHFVFLVTLLLILLINISGYFTHSFVIQCSPGISALIITHGVIMIIASGGFSGFNRKYPKLIGIILFPVILMFLLKFIYADIISEYLFALFIASTTVLSIFYSYEEISKNLRELRSSFLITRLLNSTLHNKEKLVEELKQWQEIKDIFLINHSKNETSSLNFNSLFQKSERVIHKNLLPVLAKSFENDPGSNAALETISFYFKKYNCDSLFQVSDKGDLIAIKFIPGLNPALYASEMSVMGKIAYAVYNNKSN